MGLKVFLSYGHDGNTALVLRIKRDLTAAGHRPWQRNLSISHNNVGDALSAQGDLPRALDAVGALIRTGPTGTNVGDVVIGIIG